MQDGDLLNRPRGAGEIGARRSLTIRNHATLSRERYVTSRGNFAREISLYGHQSFSRSSLCPGKISDLFHPYMKDSSNIEPL